MCHDQPSFAKQMRARRGTFSAKSGAGADYLMVAFTSLPS